MAKHSPCSWAVALDLWLQFQGMMERVLSECSVWWSEKQMKRKPWWQAQVHCGSWEASQGAPGPRVVRRTHPTKRVSVSDLCRFLPGVAGCQACALPDGQTAAGLFQDAFWREWEPSSCILLLRFLELFPLHHRPNTATTLYTSPLNGDSHPSAGFSLASPEQQVASTRLMHAFAAGGLFKKISDSFGSNNSFQGDLEERKCDINLT